MSTDINVPTLGESVTEATVAKWFKAVGDTVAMDEPLCELETDKVTVEVNAQAAGTINEILAEEGSDVEVGALLGRIDEDGGAAADKKPAEPAAEKKEAEPEAEKKPAEKKPEKKPEHESAEHKAPGDAAQALSPAVRKLVDEHGLDPSKISASGKDGRLTKGDVLAFVEQRGKAGEAKEAKPAPGPVIKERSAAADAAAAKLTAGEAGPREERVRMTRLRRMVAARLKDAQNTAAMLTTFNEIDMSESNALRARYRDAFEKRHGIRLGVMSIFVKACVAALKEFPAVNAEIDGDDLVYKNHYDIAIAVASPQGLVVPVIRDADRLSFAGIETAINEFAGRARAGQLTMDEMQGGTFTITNGGIFGSLMSTPILNPPQSGILGMHKMQPRPMVMPDGSIQARPMMYVALSYDHRIIDGREAVSFLVRVKECIEDPQRMLIES
jgi:2-oxoglutarate dehydrogenase E2 component (dihydrolipoamide succinyltransferase)